MENSALTDCCYGQMRILLHNPKLIEKYKKEFDLKEEPLGNYCSVCCPLGDKKWHGNFDRIYLPKGEFETAPNGNLRHKKTLDEDFMKYAIKIERK